MKGLKKHCIIIALISASLCVNAQTQIGNDIDGLLPDDSFGSNVSMSSNGNIVAVSAYGAANADSRLRVFKNSGGEWTLYGTDSSGGNFGGRVSFSVSLSSDGHTLAVGRLGLVSIYSYDTETGIWTQKGSDIPNNTPFEQFGHSVKLSSDGNIVAIGAIDSPIVPSPGATQIFNFETDSWIQMGNDIVGVIPHEHSGRSVDLSSDGATVAILNDDSVRVYEHNSSTWELVGTEIPAIGNQFANRTVSLSSNGTILAIGEPEFTDSFIQRGRVRVFSNTSGTWNQIGSSIIGEVAHYRTGSSVSLSSDGLVLAIGEMGSTSGSTDTGRTRIFENQGGEWIQAGNDIFGEASLDHSGRSVSLSSNGSTLAIDAPLNDGNGIDSGHVRVYDISTTLSVDDLTLSNQMHVYPNPSSDFIRISDLNTIETYTIYNMLGKAIKQGDVGENNPIDIQDFANGLYFILFENGGIKKFIKN